MRYSTYDRTSYSDVLPVSTVTSATRTIALAARWPRSLRDRFA